MKIAIIGAGITGLTAGFKLSQRGHSITIFEKEKQVGGLAAGFKPKNWQWPLEYFFHHLFISDKKAKNLINDLGLSSKLFYQTPKTSIYLNGKISQFDSAISILSSPFFSWTQKIQIGAATAYLKLTNRWSKLEKTTAQNWLIRYYGKSVYQKLWRPLLIGKFGRQKDQVSMAWFWARIKKRSHQLGYLEGGFQTLVDKLAEKIKQNQGKILLSHKVKSLNNVYRLGKFDRIIITTPFSTFLKITSHLPKNYQDKLQNLKMTGALNLILELEKKFFTDDTYWLNINQPGFPFVAIVEHTNFINFKHYGHHHLLYVGGYYHQGHRYLKMNKKQILQEFLPYLKKINPKLNIKGYYLHASLHTQPIVPVNYSQLIPPFQTPLPNIYLANMQTVYPWDRGINYAIKAGEQVANEAARK